MGLGKGETLLKGSGAPLIVVMKPSKMIIKKLPNCMYQRPDKAPDLPPQIINTKSPTCMYRAVLRAHF